MRATLYVYLAVIAALLATTIGAGTFNVYYTGAPAAVSSLATLKLSPSASPATVSSTQEGELWYDSNAHAIKAWSGSEWAALGGGTGGAGGDAVQVGAIMPFATTTAPTGWLACDGSTKSRTTYSTLFSKVGTTWGAGDGTTFGLPDLRGRTLIGVGTGDGLTARALAATGGEEAHAISEAETASHSHALTHASTPGQNSTHTASRGSPANAGASATAGSGTAHNTMMPYLVVGYFIKY